MKNPLLPLPFVCLLSVASGSVAAWAQVDATPPIPGVVGKLKAVTNNSVEIQTETGVVRVQIKQPLTIYREVPSDLSHVTSSAYVGVTSVDESAAKVEKLGGKICMPKTAVPHMGYFVVCQDTENNMFALWEVNDRAK